MQKDIAVVSFCILSIVQICFVIDSSAITSDLNTWHLMWQEHDWHRGQTRGYPGGGGHPGGALDWVSLQIQAGQHQLGPQVLTSHYHDHCHINYHYSRFVLPHQPRLDWQMWFAALGSYNHNPWLLSLVYRFSIISYTILGQGLLSKGQVRLRAQ